MAMYLTNWILQIDVRLEIWAFHSKTQEGGKGGAEINSIT
jgi:hypothetical protein